MNFTKTGHTFCLSLRAWYSHRIKDNAQICGIYHIDTLLALSIAKLEICLNSVALAMPFFEINGLQ